MENALKRHLSSAQMFAMQANINLEYEKRIENIENEIAEIKKEQEENGKFLLSVAMSSEELPQLSMRDNIRQLVNKYASAMNIRQQDVWHKIYDQLYYLYHISIRNYKESKDETNPNLK